MQVMFRFVEKYITLTEQEKSIIQVANVVESFRRNDLISGNSDAAYFVLKGCVCAFYSSSDREIVSDFFLEGDPVLIPPPQESSGESVVLRCLEDSQLAVSSAAEGERLVKAFPRFERVCRLFAEERLARSMRLNHQLRILTPIEKYELVAKERPELLGRVPQYSLASFLGIAPETLSRIRKRVVTR